MEKDLLRVFIAIKPKGLAHYLWFETKNVSEDGLYFVGKNGWGKGNAITSIKCKVEDIEGFIYSDNIQTTSTS